MLRNASLPARATQADALRLRTAPLVPEVHLFLAEDPVLLWARIEADAGTRLPAPFWATAWAGGQGLARYVLDHPDLVAGRTVLDLASGSGLVAIAAAQAGAAEVTANDIDGYAIAAIQANANANGVRLICDDRDLTDGDGGDAEVVLAGDCLYSAELAARFVPFVARAAARGATVLLGDPGRGHAPETELETVTTYDLPATSAADYEQHEKSYVLRPASRVPAMRPGR
ncbi:50S ribosomal protein L11 methyltransferase [Wangella sp. NEAU-J3]|nr:50S ribosomal protein L11 methyltransferase [Jidongwangia harbinensis]